MRGNKGNKGNSVDIAGKFLFPLRQAVWGTRGNRGNERNPRVQRYFAVIRVAQVLQPRLFGWVGLLLGNSRIERLNYAVRDQILDQFGFYRIRRWNTLY